MWIIFCYREFIDLKIPAALSWQINMKPLREPKGGLRFQTSPER